MSDEREAKAKGLIRRIRNAAVAEGMEECEHGSVLRQQRASDDADAASEELLALFRAPVSERGAEREARHYDDLADSLHAIYARSRESQTLSFEEFDLLVDVVNALRAAALRTPAEPSEPVGRVVFLREYASPGGGWMDGHDVYDNENDVREANNGVRGVRYVRAVILPTPPVADTPRAGEETK